MPIAPPCMVLDCTDPDNASGQWQYIPEAEQRAIEAAMAKAAEAASEDKPLAWLSLETNRETFRHELHARYWPGGGEPQLLASAHPHGAWVEWMAG